MDETKPPDEYDPERDGRLLRSDEVCELLNVKRSHLPNLRADGILHGYQLKPNGMWRWPSNQPTLRAARAALRGCGGTR